MKYIYWLSFTRWHVYKFAHLKNGYLLAKRIYYKGRWTPIIKLKYCKYKNYGTER